MTDVEAARQVAINAYTEHARALRELALIKQSRSWRLTGPYRWVGRLLKGEIAPKERSPHEGKELSSSYYQWR
jgi:hypothetical protein